MQFVNGCIVYYANEKSCCWRLENIKSKTELLFSKKYFQGVIPLFYASIRKALYKNVKKFYNFTYKKNIFFLFH